MNSDDWPLLLVVDVEGNGVNPPDLVEVAAALLLLHMAVGYNSWQELITVAVPPGMPGAPALHAKDETLW